jgi:hypothetical protein
LDKFEILKVVAGKNITVFELLKEFKYTFGVLLNLNIFLVETEILPLFGQMLQKHLKE